VTAPFGDLAGPAAARRPLILASGSQARRRMLEAAGVAFSVETAAVDEAAVRAGLIAERATTAAAAEVLADLKADQVARRHPSALVLGCDQVLDCGGIWFDKPADLDRAKAQLEALSGRRHRLISAVVAYGDGRRLWHHVAAADLDMRRLSRAFVDRYLTAAGPAALQSVGAYQLEGLGANLFDAVDGDFFTVLGMPLLPVLAFLRAQGHQAD
jgi:septum formation protein